MANQTITYLKSRFEKGDYPDETDFQDLLDSCYNYSLSDTPDYVTFLNTASGNWELTYNVVDAKRYNWDDAYITSTQYKNLSSTYATTPFVNSSLSNFLRLSGGTITNNLNVLGDILSGGANLNNLFLTPFNGYQSLNYNANNYVLSATNANSVSLSSLKTIVELPFTHNSFNPQSNKLYIFGQMGIAPSEAITFSNCYRSFYSGNITEATIQNSYLPGSSENHTFTLINRTKNLSAVLISNLKYTDALAVESTPLTNNLQTKPAGWSEEGTVTYSVDGVNLGNSLSKIITASLPSTSTKYQKLSVIVTGRGGGTEESGLNIFYSNNGSSYSNSGITIDGGLPQPAALSQFADTRVTFEINTSISSTFNLRFEVSGPALLKNLFVYGYFPVDTRLTYIALDPPLNVSKGDVLDVRMTTQNYSNPPTNVVNLINAKLEVTG